MSTMAPANLRATSGRTPQISWFAHAGADTPERCERSSPDPPHTICKQGQPLGGDYSHMSGGPDDAHIAGEQDALVPVDAGLPYLD